MDVKDDHERQEDVEVQENADITEPPKDPPATESVAPPPSSAPKSWASLFHKEEAKPVGNSISDSHQQQKPTARIQPYVNKVGNGSPDEDSAQFPNSISSAIIASQEDSELATFLRDYILNHKSPSLRPRGLSNRSNWCFTNAILQALIACPPFYNLMKAIPLNSEDHGSNPIVGNSSEASPVPSGRKILRAVWEFVNEFEIMTSFPKLNRNKGKKNEDLPLGKTFEATPIYNMLLNLSSDTFKVVDGRQEDAEEFLTFLLNGLNDEMLASLKTLEKPPTPKPDFTENGPGDVGGSNGNSDDGDDHTEWKEVGPKNKGVITRRQQTSKTPLAGIFQGQVR